MKECKFLIDLQRRKKLNNCVDGAEFDTGRHEMKLIARENSGMEVRIEKENFTISMGEDLVETREKFLEYMGHMFDEAVYAALSVKTMPKVREYVTTRDDGLDDELDEIVRQISSYSEPVDVLKEITDYLENGKL